MKVQCPYCRYPHFVYQQGNQWLVYNCPRFFELYCLQAYAQQQQAYADAFPKQPKPKRTKVYYKIKIEDVSTGDL